MNDNPECDVSGCEDTGKHRWRFIFLENYKPTTLYCDFHSQQRGETSEIGQYLGRWEETQYE